MEQARQLPLRFLRAPSKLIATDCGSKVAAVELEVASPHAYSRRYNGILDVVGAEARRRGWGAAGCWDWRKRAAWRGWLGGWLYWVQCNRMSTIEILFTCRQSSMN